MSYYLLLDTFLALIIIALCIYFYKKGLYEKLFEYFKLFLLLSISAKTATYTGYLLKEFNIIQPDSYSVLILIAFALNVALLFYGYKYIVIFTNRFINSKEVKTLLAKIITVIEVVVIFTFTLYIFMQFSISKKYLSKHWNKSYICSYTKNFYKKFLDYDFVYMIISSDSNVNHKEVIFKSLKNSL